MDANTQNISEATIALIDSLESTTSYFGLANSGGEYKIITEMFLYKYFNDKFGYEAKRDKIYGERLSKADKWDAEYDKFTEEELKEIYSSYKLQEITNKQFEELSQNLMSMLAEVEAIKANFSGILDENTALKLENDKLREHLSQVVQEETGTKMSHGKVNLEAIYDDGFHICPDFYGQRRDNNEACGFCAELLYGD